MSTETGFVEPVKPLDSTGRTESDRTLETGGSAGQNRSHDRAELPESTPYLCKPEPMTKSEPPRKSFLDIKKKLQLGKRFYFWWFGTIYENVPHENFEIL